MHPDEQTWHWRSAPPCRSNPAETFHSSPSAREGKWPSSTCSPPNTWVFTNTPPPDTLVYKIPPKKQIKRCAVCALSKMFSLIHGCNFLLTGQTCAPAYPWLRGRGHETANGVAGTGNTKVGGSDRLRSLRTWLHHHRCQTTARSYCKAKGEGGGGEETRSGCTDRRRERRGGDRVSKEGEIRLLSWDKGREIASGIFFSFTTQNPSRKKKTLTAEDTQGEKEGEVLLIFSPQRLFLYCRCFLKPQMSFNHRTVL